MDHRKRIETLRERIREGEGISPEDQDVLLAFSDELDLHKTTYTDARHDKLLRHCVIMAENVGGLADCVEDRDAAEDILRWINREYDNEETNRDYRTAIRVFGRRITSGDETPESLEWIPTGTSKSYSPKPNPRDMLHWNEDVLPMVESCYNARDKAMIAVAFDAGARSGEFRDLRVGDVTDHTHGLQITVDGKKGQRTVTLIPSVPYLQRWLSDHPARDDKDAPLWCKIHDSEAMTWSAFSRAFEDAAERAGVTKPVTLTNFRKSSASYLASHGMSQPHLEDHHGWVRGSTVAGRYVAVFGDAADNELARIHGKDVSESEPDPIGPVTCPRCDRETPREKDFCVWCEQALSPDAVDRLKTDEKEVQRVLLGLAREDPSLLEDAEQREKVVSALSDNPDLQVQAKQLVEELGLDI